VENSLNFSALSIEILPQRKDELKEFLNKIRGGGYP
jgi:hypothetical protein